MGHIGFKELYAIPYLKRNPYSTGDEVATAAVRAGIPSRAKDPIFSLKTTLARWARRPGDSGYDSRFGRERGKDGQYRYFLTSGTPTLSNGPSGKLALSGQNLAKLFIEADPARPTTLSGQDLAKLFAEAGVVRSDSEALSRLAEPARPTIGKEELIEIEKVLREEAQARDRKHSLIRDLAARLWPNVPGG